MSTFPPEGRQPEDYEEHLRQTRVRKWLAEQKNKALRSLDAEHGEVGSYADVIVEAASEFFDYSEFAANDFGVQAGHLEEGVVVFGGTNRLQWSLKFGFRYSPSHCSEKFIARFREVMGCDRTF